MRRRARLLSCSTFSYLRVELSRLNAQPAGDRGPVVPWQRWGWGPMTPRDRGRPRPARTAGATNRDGRARVLEADNSIVAVVTRYRKRSGVSARPGAVMRRAFARIHIERPRGLRRLLIGGCGFFFLRPRSGFLRTGLVIVERHHAAGAIAGLGGRRQRAAGNDRGESKCD